MIRTVLCCLFLGSYTSVEAQTVTLRLTGTIDPALAAPVSIGYWAGTAAGDPVVLQVDLEMPAFTQSPVTAIHELDVSSYVLRVGTRSARATPVFGFYASFSNDLAGRDELDLTFHSLEGLDGAFADACDLWLWDSSAAWLDSTDPTQELGLTAGDQFDGEWFLHAPGQSVAIDVGSIELTTDVGVLASATRRVDSAGVNAGGFVADLPLLGGTWTASVTNPAGGPWTSVGVAAYPRSAEVPLASGSVLVDLTGGELLGLAPISSASGSWSVPVPADAALAGARFSVQGYGFGGGALVLHNAYDCVVGS